MANKELWDKIFAERTALADDVAGLKPAQLDKPSLCGGWTVRDVLGHVIGTGHTSPLNFFGSLLAAGFSFNKFADKKLKQWNSGSPTELADKLRAITTSTTSPPGPPLTWLGEVVVHGEDVRRPLGIKHQYPADHLVAVADFYKGSNLLIGAKKRISGFTIAADDVHWSTGTGPEVTGPGAALISAMTGRKAALDDLSGAGLQQFAARF
ncbi:MAG TPA: maleylpyruvate isomerase family mycothiol-dependent enzyme [Acidimicrobiales bacterium]|nr:maleylpyruvate isomerase family mycothiol-dependent enzyme [Acidimicrobiales bacterium]